MLKPLGRRSYVVESNGQIYIRNRRHLKHSAEADSVPAEEWTTPSSYHGSKVKNHFASEQPTLKPVATTKVNQSTITIESNKDQPLSATSVDRDRAVKDHAHMKAMSAQEVGDWSNHLVVIQIL